MKKSILITGNILAALLLFTSCNENAGSSSFKTKEDSINFAKAVMQQYPESRNTSTRPLSRPAGDTTRRGEGMQPISWEEVVSLQSNYDAGTRLMNRNGQSFQGFTIDSNGYRMLQEDSEIFGLYLRLGRKADSSYTIIVRGIGENGRLLQNSAQVEGNHNYDNLMPCPNQCP